MRYTLDFNAIEQPSIELIFRDAARTRVTVTAPTTALIERMASNRTTMVDALAGKDLEAVPHVYDLMAELISCNEQGITITGTDLREKYGWDNLIYPLAFYKKYLEMIEEIQNAKN